MNGPWDSEVVSHVVHGRRRAIWKTRTKAILVIKWKRSNNVAAARTIIPFPTAHDADHACHTILHFHFAPHIPLSLSPP